MTDQQKSDREKAKQSWGKRRHLMTVDVAHGHRLGISDFKSSLKRDIEKRIAEFEDYRDRSVDEEQRFAYQCKIVECKFIAEMLIETVEP